MARSIDLDGEILAQRQIPFDQTVQKTVETPQLQCIDKVVDDPVVQVPRVQVLEKTAEISQLQTVEKIGETPQTQTIQGTQAPESLAITPVCQVEQTGHVEELVERHGPTAFGKTDRRNPRRDPDDPERSNL